MSRKNLTNKQQLSRLEKQGKILIVFGLCLNIITISVAVLSWIFLGWPFAFYFSALIPIMIFQYILMYSTNKIAISNLRRESESDKQAGENENV